MFPLGKQAPSFTLIDVTSGGERSLESLRSEKATVIAFICNHCPFVKLIREELVRVANDYISQGISFIAINSNDAEAYPDDSPEKMKEVAAEFQFPFPYLLICMMRHKRWRKLTTQLAPRTFTSLMVS
jgi:thiol-disulfide isomerase/thioredoxin